MKRSALLLSTFVATLLLSFGNSIGQDSIRVKVKSIKGNQVVMKTLDRPRVKFMTFCKCPYRKKQIVWIKKPEL